MRKITGKVFDHTRSLSLGAASVRPFTISVSISKLKRPTACAARESPKSKP